MCWPSALVVMPPMFHPSILTSVNLGNAGAITGSVWVRGLTGNCLGFVEFERVVHETSVTSVVLS